MFGAKKIHHQALSVLIVEDHQIYRETFQNFIRLIARKENIEITTAEAGTGEDAIEKVKQADYDIIFMDYDLGSGINGSETVTRILQVKHTVKILALSSHEDLFIVDEFINAGAKGYMIKDVDKQELLLAVKTILAGEMFFCKKIRNKMQNRY